MDGFGPRPIAWLLVGLPGQRRSISAPDLERTAIRVSLRRTTQEDTILGRRSTNGPALADRDVRVPVLCHSPG